MDHLCFLVRYGLKDCLKGGYHLLLTETQKERLLKVLPLTLLLSFSYRHDLSTYNRAFCPYMHR